MLSLVKGSCDRMQAWGVGDLSFIFQTGFIQMKWKNSLQKCLGCLLLESLLIRILWNSLLLFFILRNEDDIGDQGKRNVYSLLGSQSPNILDLEEILEMNWTTAYILKDARKQRFEMRNGDFFFKRERDLRKLNVSHFYINAVYNNNSFGAHMPSGNIAMGNI